MTEHRTARWPVAALFLLLAIGCGGGGNQQAAATDSLSRRERDSIIGASRLPGAPGVRRALQVSDSAAARAGRIDSAGR